MSPREELSVRLGCWIEEWATAPYGVTGSLFTPDSGRGKARQISFGLAGTLDATLTIWSLTRLDLSVIKQAPPTTLTFASEQEFRDYCVKEFGAK